MHKRRGLNPDIRFLLIAAIGERISNRRFLLLRFTGIQTWL